MKTEYFDELKELLNSTYDPVDSLNDQSDYTERKSLSSLHKEVTNILPAKWVDESDVYAALKELGFKSFLVTIPAEVDEEGETIKGEIKKMAYLLDKKTATI